MPAQHTAGARLDVGQIVHVRSRQYLVEDVIPPPHAGESRLVRLSCLEDDAQGQPLTVLWDREIDARVIGASPWTAITEKGFDDPRRFSAYLHTLRWNCVTATDHKLFQAPYRAGIEVKAYQLEPLRKALMMPRVNMFIADDVGLGKTIEAGLILRELLMRQKVRRVVVCCPPSVVRQWQEEMEQRFGLTFIILDRDYVAKCRRERGYGVNPWNTHSRFILSHALLRSEPYAAPLRDWLRSFSPGALLILDEAHNAAPASGGKYAIDSRLTKTVRDIAPRFEHRLFLSATPHNGHSNSFSALLEILDPQRFCRGVPVDNTAELDAVMVRRLKSDLAEISDDFPERRVIQVTIDGLPDDAPELALSRLLQRYRAARERRLKDATKAKRASAMLVVTSLQKRLLSSVDAFARTLSVHRKAMERQAEARAPKNPDLSLLTEAVGADDERAELPEADVQAEEDAQVQAATRTGGEPSGAELALLEEMAAIAEGARYHAGVKAQRLIDWIRESLLDGDRWLDRRVLIFTEYTDTKGYLVRKLEEALDHPEGRIQTFHGGIGEERREEIKAAFNSDPADSPLRILIATDAAREGVNLQNHCADLFHFDVPWNPSRMEQRNGRIDRRLQRAKVVRCHYFVLPQRVEDRVLQILVKKTARIKDQLGSISPVLERNLTDILSGGIEHDRAAGMEQRIDTAEHEGAESDRVIARELEATRKRKKALEADIAELNKMLKDSREWLGLSQDHFRDAISASLELLGATSLRPLDGQEAVDKPETARWVFPPLDEQTSSWAVTLDALRRPRQRTEKLHEWRREAPIRPIVFRDPGSLDGQVVHIHLEHRIIQRLLGRFLSQGFRHHDISRACVCSTDEATPMVLAIGRLSLYGEGAARLHDEVLAVAAEWTPPESRGRGKLKAMNIGQTKDALALVETSLATPRLQVAPEVVKARFQASAAQDVSELLPRLEQRSDTLIERATRDLTRRGETEGDAMADLLRAQMKRIREQEARLTAPKGGQQLLAFSDKEKRQLSADRRHWAKRLEDLALDLEREPERIRQAYTVRAHRIDPVGLVYLWPVSS